MAALEIDWLRSFVEVADSGGFGRAARRRNRTQSTISLHMRRLEQVSAARLIDRGPRQFALTEAGRLLLDDARRLLAAHDEALARLRQPALHGQVTTGVAEEIAGRQLPRILAAFAQIHPAVRLEVKTGLALTLRRPLQQGEIDLLIARRIAGMRDVGTPLWREKLVWAGGSSGMPDGDVLPLALFGEGCLFRVTALSALTRAGRRWRIAYTGTGLAGVQAAVVAGLGISALGRSAVQPEMRVLGAEDGMPALPDSEIALYCRNRPSAPVKALARLIEERFVPPLVDVA